jgi:hypothetical protein
MRGILNQKKRAGCKKIPVGTRIEKQAESLKKGPAAISLQRAKLAICSVFQA